MPKTTSIIFFLSLFGAGLCSCKTYTLGIDSFNKQFSKNSFRIDSIHCTDKNGNEVVVKNNPAFEIHITDLNDEKTSFSLQSIRIQHDTLIGGLAQQDDGALQNIPNYPAYSFKRKIIPVSSIRKITLVSR